MSDRYTEFVNSGFGKQLAKSLGLPQPVKLRRYQHGVDFIDGDSLIGASARPGLAEAALAVIGQSSGKIYVKCDNPDAKALTKQQDYATQDFDVVAPDKVKTIVFDASGIENSSQLKSLYLFFHQTIRSVSNAGRVVILGRPPEHCASTAMHTAQRALIGFTKSLAKEVGKGSTANLVYVRSGCEHKIESTLRFLLSARSAYVSGQYITIASEQDASLPASWEQPLAGKTALVTGAARGIGEAIAGIFARQGAHVICLDIPPSEEALNKVASKLGGSSIAADITADNTATKILAHLDDLNSKLDILVHNAGVTRDKTIAKMPEGWWDMTLNINLSCQEKLNTLLLEKNIIPAGGRIICVSSMNGIAGARGQTNYSASKAGVIGMVESMAPVLEEKQITINAVAPGFIETEMTAAMPFAPREFGRRMNSLSQGGLPEDVGETICWFANPASSGVNGNVVRVCGQHFIGA